MLRCRSIRSIITCRPGEEMIQLLQQNTLQEEQEGMPTMSSPAEIHRTAYGCVIALPEAVPNAHNGPMPVRGEVQKAHILKSKCLGLQHRMGRGC